MRFVKTVTAEKPHMLAHWQGPVMWMVCGEIIDMGRSSVMVTEKLPEEVCGVCSMIELRNAYIPGATQ